MKHSATLLFKGPTMSPFKHSLSNTMTFIPYLCYIWNEDLLWLLSCCIQHFKFITKVTKQTWTYSIYICTDELQEKINIMSIPRTAQAKDMMPHTGAVKASRFNSTVETCCVLRPHYTAEHQQQTLNLREYFWAHSQRRSNITTQGNAAISASLALSLSTSFSLSTFFQNHSELTWLLFN